MAQRLLWLPDGQKTLLRFDDQLRQLPLLADASRGSVQSHMVSTDTPGAYLKTGTFDTIGPFYPTYETSPDGPTLLTTGKTWAPPNVLPLDATSAHRPIRGEDMCEECEDIDLDRLLGSSAERRIQLGSAEAMLKCKCCALCRLVTASFAMSSDKHIEQLLAETSPYAVILLQSILATIPAPRRVQRYYEIRAYLIEQAGPYVTIQSQLRLLADDAHKISKSRYFRGRLMQSQHWNAMLAREWLMECSDTHSCLRRYGNDGVPNNVTWTTELREKESSILVIDVELSCLVEISMRLRYTTLSYVWPRFPAVQLTRRNLPDFKIPGALSNEANLLTNVQSEAIQVVRSLGERYLWIDALCVIQDDMQVKEKLIHKMDFIYGYSYLNIIVASCGNPSEDYHIPGVGAPRSNRRQVVEEVQGIRLVNALKDYNDVLAQTIWATRGWTFQEGILSPRCLVFTEEQMYFRCPQDSRCEDIVSEGIPHSYETHPAKPKQRRSKIDFLANADAFRSVAKNERFKEYVFLVQEYTKRKLSFQHDILFAFAGIMGAVTALFQRGGFFWGLPTYQFDRALLWQPAPCLERYKPEMSGDERIYTSYPSWSWAGWVGHVDYGIDATYLTDTSQQFSAVMWYRYTSGEDRLIPVRPDALIWDEGRDTEFARGLLWGKRDTLRKHPHCIVGWAGTVRVELQRPEIQLNYWLTEREYSVACFTVLDNDFLPCGFVISTERDWAKRYAQGDGGKCELLILSHSSKTEFDEALPMAKLFDPTKYPMGGSVCFFNVMLVEYNEEGIGIRKACGKVDQRIGIHDVCKLDFKIVVLG